LQLLPLVKASLCVILTFQLQVEVKIIGLLTKNEVFSLNFTVKQGFFTGKTKINLGFLNAFFEFNDEKT
jgi:hypothetical protein